MSRHVILQRPLSLPSPQLHRIHGRAFCASAHVGKDPRIPDLGKEIIDDYAQLREHYATPRYPIVLAHGLFGFSELRLVPRLPAVQYWHGIQDALRASGATVFATSVPPSSSIAVRAATLAEGIAAAQQAAAGAASPSSPPPPVNIIAHSMGGLDARYMISQLLPHANVRVASLTTIATPHRGSPVADYLVNADSQSPIHLPSLYSVLSRAGFGTEAFEQLTTRYMAETFNPATPDVDGVRYFSYGADMGAPPPLLGVFRPPWRVIQDKEGANDGLVSVASSRWGDYRGTLVGVSHLDLINWSNRMRWALRAMMGMKRTFNAVAFYMDIADMLAKEKL
ncbi:GPI inositol-deacylase PGAP1-like protein [Akanthomyces lecanii RCEF 1005]|uniref:GPI inositol-deacylase PGAP1-like protein n=1 Tax=Akanthomyces lecanii RCEF 1005 TaxID=1081108 RepID=A0A168DL16_CORDF|nr:GPI inositol-deacylase PGAP1-like protein [Akanthomyces lecanii RCEF 1005]